MENPFNFEQASYSDLLAEAKRLNSELATLQNKSLYTERAFANRDRQYAEAKEVITSLIENDEISDEDAVTKLIEIFGIEILKTVEFTLTIEVTGTLELPMGTELDEYSFNVDSISYDGSEVSLDHDSVTIENWNFTE